MGKDLSRLRIDRSRNTSGGRSGWLAFAILLLALAGYFGYRKLGAGPQAPEVEVGRVRRVGGAAAQTGVSANGYVVARRRAALSTDIQGRIVDLPVVEGQAVAEGELIARLDTSELEARHRRAQAERREARAALTLAGLERERLAPLVAKGYASPIELDRAKAAEDRAQASVASLDAAIGEIRVQIDKSSVRAPFAGVVVQKNAEVGEVVSPMSTGAGASSRGSVVTLIDRASLEVQVELAQTSLAAAQPGAAVLIYLDAWPEDAYRGQVRQIWPTADRQKATVELRCAFERMDDRVLPEMGVRVVFLAEGTDAAGYPAEILVPASAVVQEGSGALVLLFRPGAEDANLGTVRRETIEVGESRGTELVATSGLSGGELVLLRPSPGVVDGALVRRRANERGD